MPRKEHAIMNEEFIKKIRPAINRVWESIGGDLEESYGGRRIPYSHAIEACIDADRLPMFAREEGKVADEVIKEALKSVDYETLLSYIAKHIKLGF